MVPLGLALLVLLLASTLSTYRLQQWRIDGEVRAHIDDLKKTFQLEIDQGGRLLNGLIDFIKEDPDLQKAWLAKDEEDLLAHSQPILNKLRETFRITHFYYHGLDSVCFLRVHKPPRKGDYIDRFTLADAVDKGTPSHGVELGPLGTFTLRAVYPWMINGELVGFIELGIDIEGLALHLKETLRGELLVVIEKSYLQRADWEEGMKMLGRDSNWDQFEDFVVVEATTGTIPNVLAANMEKHHKQEHEEFLFSVLLDGQRYRSGFVPLFDAGDREVGEIIYMDDVTETAAALQTSLAVTTGVYVIIATLLFGFFYLLLGRLEDSLEQARTGLETANKQLEAEAEELKQAKDDLTEEVEQRAVIEHQLQRNIFELEQAKQEALRMMQDAQAAERRAGQSQQALQASEQRYRALFEQSPDGILIADIETAKFKYANPAICKMLGYTEAELKNMAVADIHPKDALDYIAAEYDAQARGEKAFAESVPCLKKDGTTMHADVNTIKMLVDGQNCEIGFFRNVSQRSAFREGQAF